MCYYHFFASAAAEKTGAIPSGLPPCEGAAESARENRATGGKVTNDCPKEAMARTGREGAPVEFVRVACRRANSERTHQNNTRL